MSSAFEVFSLFFGGRCGRELNWFANIFAPSSTLVRQRESKYQPRVYPLVSLRRSNWNGRQSSCTTCARETKKEKVAIRGREIITRHVSIGRDDDAYEQHEHR